MIFPLNMRLYHRHLVRRRPLRSIRAPPVLAADPQMAPLRIVARHHVKIPGGFDVLSRTDSHALPNLVLPPIVGP
jgi:hypothetical protein